MGLQDLLYSSTGGKKIGISEERINAVLPTLREYVAFWRWYPDIFIDTLVKIGGGKFKFFYYQRIFLRVVLRHRIVYCVFPRA